MFNRFDRSGGLAGWMFIAPSLLLIGIFMIYPILWSLWMSFQVGRGVNLSFGGFANIVRLTQDPVLLRALGNTLIFFVVQVPIMLMLAMLLAVALNDPKLRFRGLFRTAIFLPCVTSLVAYSALFKSMFSNDGVVNDALMAIGLLQEPIQWMADPFWAKVLIILAVTWRWTGYNMIFFLAALQSIPPVLYEAAHIDGASSTQQFRFVTLPTLAPTLLLVSILTIAGYFQLFAEPYVMTQGGPMQSTVSVLYFMYEEGFKWWNLGTASAVAFVLFFLLFLITRLQIAATRRWSTP